ncbi:UDP-2,4-diacetamido-2,4,6-trideoxy-beta-L-altropyranose hydrolase [Neolewinella marina]|uniref:UDP-2,4-diacetamido-2,4, 6-trideoxy-beta-L-altropyranose hydrolase n=1 Tax=Neolewinella marina TaxID=438751 RepID=A0A2G0CBY7_9BACT|nr:UDP-2,4-diacetamido-2,4,6-trideoxy-beta-L-altropyranose hydrolase [Neolewinella marina]
MIRVDGGPAMGLGHLIRCTALAHMLEGAFNAVFVCQQGAQYLENRESGNGFDVVQLDAVLDDVEQLIRLSKVYTTAEGHPPLVVLDGYHFGADYQLKLKNNGLRVVSIDDIHRERFYSDVIINHSGGFSREDYDVPMETLLYTGLEYCLLRPPFLQAANNRSAKRFPKSSIFICLGGADPNNDTLAVLDLLYRNRVVDRKVNLVLGSAFQHEDALMAYIHKNNIELEIFKKVSAEGMVGLMEEAKFAVTPPSTTSYEYLCVNQNLLLYKIADNQKRMEEYLTGVGMATTLRSFIGDQQFRNNPDLQNQCFDGKQRTRIIDIFKNIA